MLRSGVTRSSLCECPPRERDGIRSSRFGTEKWSLSATTNSPASTERRMRTWTRTVKRPTTIQRIMSNSNCLVCTNTSHVSCFQGMANGLIRKNVVH